MKHFDFKYAQLHALFGIFYNLGLAIRSEHFAEEDQFFITIVTQAKLAEAWNNLGLHLRPGTF